MIDKAGGFRRVPDFHIWLAYVTCLLDISFKSKRHALGI